MTPSGAALTAATDRMLAAVRDRRADNDAWTAAAVPVADQYAAGVIAEFAGHEELAGRVVLATASIVAQLTLAAGVCREGVTGS